MSVQTTAECALEPPHRRANLSRVEEDHSGAENQSPLNPADHQPSSLSLVKGGWSKNQSHGFRRRFFPHTTLSQWNDWHWQLRNRVTSLTGLERFLVLSPQEAAAGGPGKLPLAVTPYYLSLIDSKDPDDALRRCVIPCAEEAIFSPGEAADPLAEESHTVLPGLVHRYPDRVLLLATGFCSTYCRYCTRSRLVGDKKGHYCAGRNSLEAAFAYIEANPQVRDVLISGGDPLTLSDERLDWILTSLRRIKHVEIVRLGSKVPAVLPQRVTPALTRMLKKHHPLYISLHFVHPDELTPESQAACARLADAGIPLGSQTVLLKGVNDQVETMTRLVQGLLRARVRPYYLYQCDPVAGSAHFRTTVAKGLEIIEGLRGFTTGYAVPTYVIDAPGGGGKIALYPQTVVGQSEQGPVLRNFQGNLYTYPDQMAPVVVTH